MADKEKNDIIQRFNSGIASEEERQIVREWLMFGKFSATSTDEHEISESLKRIRNRVLILKRPVRFKYPWRLTAIAATILVFIGIGIDAFLDTKRVDNERVVARSADIGPGTNRAFLTLANGRRIDLSAAENGKIMNTDGVTITKMADGKLLYQFAEIGGNSQLKNTISTPRGGQHQVTLPDGTTVWLNAASSMTFPVSFKHSKVRRIELEGEAYFEVAKDKIHPFIVSTKGQEVKVLGTHFNINGYADEDSVKTTLLEGAIEVNGSVLKPGEQAIYYDKRIGVERVDTEKVIAWKNGKFVFKSESIKSIMRKLSRWYDVEVVYTGDVSDETFTGSIGRYDNISSILDKITFTQAVHFKIEGRRITVKP